MPTATSCIKTAPIPGAYASSPLSQVAGLGSLAQGVLGKCGIASLSNFFSSTPSTGAGTAQVLTDANGNPVYTSSGLNTTVSQDPGVLTDANGNPIPSC